MQATFSVRLLFLMFITVLLSLGCSNTATEPTNKQGSINWQAIEQERIQSLIDSYYGLPPVTVTASRAQRSAGGIHDFYSEGDYWWPNPNDPDGPYIRRDGESNPDNFLAHRKAMIRLADIIGVLTSAYLIEKDERYAKDAANHLRAWFVDQKTMMHPSLKYAQAIKGRYTGRSIGVIDTLHLVEIAMAVKVLENTAALQADLPAIKAWFSAYLKWINSHPYGLQEKVHPNNHGVCWSLQASAFAHVTGETRILDWIESQFKSVYLQQMMDKQGGFKDELTRTKPYGYSLFIVDVMAGVAQLLELEGRSVWAFATPDGKSMALAMNFIYPYIADKSAWPYQQDILYWDQWPVRHPSLLFSAIHLSKPEYLNEWSLLEPDPIALEVKRNLPIRYPLLWVK